MGRPMFIPRSVFTLFLSSLCLCASVVSPAFGASPSLGGISPVGAQRGTEAVLTFGGARLADTQEVLVYYPGITVKNLEVVNDAAVKVTVQIAPDCRLGEHAFRLRTASGVSDLRNFWVGALPTADEKEPNSDFEKPQPIAPPCCNRPMPSWSSRGGRKRAAMATPATTNTSTGRP